MHQFWVSRNDDVLKQADSIARAAEQVAEAEFGRPTFLQASMKRNALPGNARMVSTKLIQFPYYKCLNGACTYGPGGCNCVACFCERPDGSTYLVLEHCKSQSVTFGDLPVQLVKRGNRHLQQV